VDKGYLYDSPNLSDKTRIYLVRGDQIKLLSYKNNFYKIEYTSKENKIIKNGSSALLLMLVFQINNTKNFNY